MPGRPVVLAVTDDAPVDPATVTLFQVRLGGTSLCLSDGDLATLAPEEPACGGLDLTDVRDRHQVLLVTDGVPVLVAAALQERRLRPDGPHLAVSVARSAWSDGADAGPLVAAAAAWAARRALPACGPAALVEGRAVECLDLLAPLDGDVTLPPRWTLLMHGLRLGALSETRSADLSEEVRLRARAWREAPAVVALLPESARRLVLPLLEPETALAAGLVVKGPCGVVTLTPRQLDVKGALQAPRCPRPWRRRAHRAAARPPRSDRRRRGDPVSPDGGTR